MGWGEGTLEGKAGAVIACMNDFRDFVIGADPMQVEHIWQSMYVHSFYRAGPVIGSAISGIDQALWDIRGKVLGMPVYKLLGGPFDPRGVRGYYHADGANARNCSAARDGIEQGVSCFKTGFPAITSGSRLTPKIERAVKQIADAAGRARARYRHRRGFPRQDQPERGFGHHQGSRAAELLFVEEPVRRRT